MMRKRRRTRHDAGGCTPAKQKGDGGGGGSEGRHTREEAARPEISLPPQAGFEELIWGNVIPTREEQEKLLRDAGLKGAVGRELIGEGFTVLTVRH